MYENPYLPPGTCPEDLEGEPDDNYPKDEKYED